MDHPPVLGRTRRRTFGAVLASLLVLTGLIIGVNTAAADGTTAGSSRAPACVKPEKPRSATYDAATRSDRAFQKDFRHCFTTVRGVQMHYVIGGHGPQTLVLLHGWPQSWYEWHGVMPDLLPGRTVIAVDLPGMGDTTGEPPSYTKAVLAEYTHLLLEKIGKDDDVKVAGHDFGAGVGYAMAAQYREQVTGLFFMDFPLVGKNLTAEALKASVWHYPFFLQEPLAEELATGRVHTLLTRFYPTQTHVPQPIPPSDITEYTRVYSRPQVLHAGFELYRTWHQDELDNKRFQDEPLTIPVHVLTEGGYWADVLVGPVKDAAPGATSSVIEEAGHWLLEEQPEKVLAAIDSFYPTP